MSPSIRHYSHTLATTVLMLCLLLVVSACSTSGTGDETNSSNASTQHSPYEADIKDALNRATTKREKRMLTYALKHGKFRESDINDIVVRQEQCYTDAGYTNVHFEISGAGQATLPEGLTEEERKKIDDQCTFDDETSIISLYSEMHSNPDKQDMNKLTATCLVRKKLVDEGFTVHDFKSINSDPKEGEEWFNTFLDSSRPSYDEKRAQQFKQCLTNPKE